MTVQIDEATVRQFIELISQHVKATINGAGPPGVLQICRISPIDDSVVPNRFVPDDIENMVKTAVGDAANGFNIYIEARTVRPDLRGNLRGSLDDTAWVFGLVADCDADKGKGGDIKIRPSLVIETSPGNFHYWYLFTRAITAVQARLIGEVIRANSGTDQDTGVVTQCYRVAGTPNYPSCAKQARGRVSVEPTRISEWTGRLWDPDELLKAFQGVAAATATTTAAPSDAADEATLPDDLLKDIREGGVGKKNDNSRSALFQSVVHQLKRRHWSIENIVRLFEKYPNGVAAKYQKRLRKEVERSYGKAMGGSPPFGAAVIGGIAPGPGAASGAGTAPGAAPGAAPGTGPAAAPQPAAALHVLPTIRLVGGQLPRIVRETERALLLSGAPIFSRAGTLVYPTVETVTAADGRKTVTAKLREFTADSLLEPLAEAAIYQRFSIRQKCWVDADPPLQLVRMVLTRNQRWAFPHVSGIITTPTLRCDGSLLAAPGYDQRSELYLLPGLQLPPIPERPTRAQAEEALAIVKELFSEFSFKHKALDCSVAISALLTAQLRGSLPTAPIHLMAADTSGTGKSYLLDVIATIVNGRYCPVIAVAESKEEFEKQLGAILLSGAPIVSLDNCDRDLGGNLLCQLSERPVVNIRILGRSEMPECESHTAVFATGNNITFKRDMLRRGLTCNLEALDERPELRVFKRDAMEVAAANRGVYVAAGLTIVRAYFTAGAPSVCGPLASYAAWTKMVRSPLVWLGEPDPCLAMDEARAEDWELATIRELFELWLAYDLGLDTEYTTPDIMEITCRPPAPNDYAPQSFKHLLLRVARIKDAPDTVSADRLGWWLRRISGRIVSLADTNGETHRYRLIKGQGSRGRACFRLVEVI
jgi:putative DNA primase/helicase